MDKKTIAFIGLGVMGYPMAGHLAQHGHTLQVYNRTSTRAEAWCAEYSGQAFRSPKEAAKGADIVCACVGNDDDVRAVVFGQNGALNGMHSGSIFIDHTTTSASLARELHSAFQAKHIAFLDAPVSGGQIGAEQGQLTIMIGGQEADFKGVQGILALYAKSAVLMGDVGAGQLTKMVNQICVAGLLQGLSEGLNFGINAGLDMEKVIQVISKGAAQSWQMDHRSHTMVKGEFDFGFAVNWMIKDLGFCLNEAQTNGSQLPTTALIDQFYKKLQAQGKGQYDTSSLIDLLRTPPSRSV